MWMKTYAVFSEGRRQDDSEECKTLKEFEIQLDWMNRIKEEEEALIEELTADDS
jgi:hypothetical protein